MLLLESTTRLPYRHRLLISMLATIERFFGHDERLTALSYLLYREIDEVTEDADEFNAQANQLTTAMKQQRRFDHECNKGA